MALPARFHDMRNRTLAAVDHAFAEPVRLSPMKDGRPDPDRPQYIFEAVLRTESDQSRSPTGAAGSSGQEWKSRVSSGLAKLHVDRAVYNGPDIREGDQLRALARVGEPVFAVEAVEGADHSRLVVHLTEAGN